METITLIILISIASAATGFLVGRHLLPTARTADQIALATAQGDSKRLGEEIAEMEKRFSDQGEELQRKVDALAEEEKKFERLDERSAGFAKRIEELDHALAAARADQTKAEGDAQAASENVARLTEREAGLTRESVSLSDQLKEMTKTRDDALNEAKAATEEVARLTERLQGLSKEVEDLRAREGKLQETLKVEFENIATRVLKANATELTDTSQKQISAILDPLRERIQEFQGRVETTYDAEKREVLSLKEQIRMIVETSQNLGLQADGLAKALKGDVQMLGRWGELVLDRVLQKAGLVEGREYITQGRGLGLKNEDGGLQRPDVIVLLPEKRTMIVDSKVSLASYDRLILAKDEGERLEHATQFVRDMKAHIDGLANKKYQDNEQIGAHDCVLMFVPIEGALAAALTAEPELFTYAWDKRVVLVGPPTLLMTLRTVASIWRYELQAQNAQEIARLAGSLCDKVGAGLGDLNIVADKINQALEAHNEAVKRLSTGKGNALSIGERIRNLGVKTKGPMPAMIVDGERVAGELEFAGDAEDGDAEDEVREGT
jgi:DNA recombination protein RmuC